MQGLAAAHPTSLCASSDTEGKEAAPAPSPLPTRSNTASWANLFRLASLLAPSGLRRLSLGASGCAVDTRALEAVNTSDFPAAVAATLESTESSPQNMSVARDNMWISKARADDFFFGRSPIFAPIF